MAQRPVGVTILAIWFFLNGIFSFVVGIGVLFIPLPSAFAGITLVTGITGVLSGALLFAIGWGLLISKNWARVIALVLSVIGLLFSLVVGAVLIAGVAIYQGQNLNYPGVGAGFIVLGLLEGLIIYYLLHPDVDAFFSEARYAYPAQSTIIAPPPTPVVTAPAPVSTLAPQPRLPETHVIGAPPPPSAWLVARTGARAGKEYGLQLGRNTIGRDGTLCDIVLDDSTVSKHHAELRYENGQFVLYDLASMNGTTVNNHRVQRQSLLDGDDIKFGNVQFVFKEVKVRPNR